MKKNRCSVCNHRDKKKIEARVMNGETMRSICKGYKFSPATLSRHKTICMANCIVKAIVRNPKAKKKMVPEHNQYLAAQIQESEDENCAQAGLSIIDNLNHLQEEAQDILRLTKEDKSYNVALNAIDKLAKLHELTIKFAAEAREQEKARNEKKQTDQEIVIEIMMGILDEFPDAYKRFTSECSRRKIITG